jgi:hypothetical protein
MEIKKIRIRFDRYIHQTGKAYLLEYEGKRHWLSKKICWNVMVAGNDLHAWAEVPPFIFKELTGKDIDEVAKDYGEKELREYFGVIIHTRVEKHKPEKVSPVKSNEIKELKR